MTDNSERRTTPGALDANGNLYVTDDDAGQISEFNRAVPRSDNHRARRRLG